MKKLLLFLLLPFLVVAFFIAPKFTYADTAFTVTNMDFNSSTGAFSFDYDAGGVTLNHQITLRLPYSGTSFNYDVNSPDFTCDASHCSGTFSGDKSNFTCSGSDYRVMSTTNVNGGEVQYTSNSLSASEFSSECSNGPTPTPTPTSSPTPTPTPPALPFTDQFNGSGELSQYNSAYQCVSDFSNVNGTPECGSMYVETDHVRAGFYDPAYVYTPITQDNICASIDFNWTGKQDNGANGGWTNIILHSTPNHFGTTFQIRSDDATHQRWQFYYNGQENNPNGPVSFDITQTHTIKACESGTTIRGYLDGNLLFTGQDTHASGGNVGFASQDPTYYLDNFKIEAFTNPTPTTLTPTADSYIKQGSANENEGASTFLRLQQSGHNRSLVKFDESQIQAAVGNSQNFTAKLQFTITDNGNNWGTTGRSIEIHRLNQNWAEGNGFIDGNSPTNRGTGSGVTWNCATDSNIANSNNDCSGTTAWNMTNSSLWPFASAVTASSNITNNQTGTVEFDVTSDVQSFINGSNQNYGWLIKKTDEGQNGRVEFGSKESNNSPKLIITPN